MLTPNIIVFDFESMLPNFGDDRNKKLKFTHKQVPVNCRFFK